MLDYTLSNADSSMLYLLEANAIKAMYVSAHLFHHEVSWLSYVCAFSCVLLTLTMVSGACHKLGSLARVEQHDNGQPA